MCITLIITKQSLQASLEDEDEEGGASGYSAAYARLHNAAFNEPDPVPNVQDTSKYLAESIGRFSQVCPEIMLALQPNHMFDVILSVLS